MIRLGVGEARIKAVRKDLRSSITEFYFLHHQSVTGCVNGYDGTQ